MKPTPHGKLFPRLLTYNSDGFWVKNPKRLSGKSQALSRLLKTCDVAFIQETNIRRLNITGARAWFKARGFRVFYTEAQATGFLGVLTAVRFTWLQGRRTVPKIVVEHHILRLEIFHRVSGEFTLGLTNVYLKAGFDKCYKDIRTSQLRRLRYAIRRRSGSVTIFARTFRGLSLRTQGVDTFLPPIPNAVIGPRA